MRNLSFLLQKFGFIILFLALQGIAFFLILQRSNFQKVAFLNSTNELTGNLYSYYGGFKEYFYLKRENDILAEENLRLYAMIEQSRRDFATKEKGIDSSYQQIFTYTPCQVINNSLSKSQNYFTIDAGLNQGIHPGMGVISPSGIAGVVKGVSSNFAICISVLNINFPVSVQLRKTGDAGTLEWDGESPVYSKLTGIPNHVDVQLGDTLETSGLKSRIFPQGVLVGFVAGYSINPDDGSYIVKVRLSTSFTAIRHVYAIDYKYEKEQKQLEDSLAVDIANVSHD
jgi:rod shape-determining protein MreC